MTEDSSVATLLQNDKRAVISTSGRNLILRETVKRNKIPHKLVDAGNDIRNEKSYSYGTKLLCLYSNELEQ
jgi:hypothetical protein